MGSKDMAGAPLGEVLQRTVHLFGRGLSICMHLLATPRADQQPLDGGDLLNLSSLKLISGACKRTQSACMGGDEDRIS